MSEAAHMRDSDREESNMLSEQYGHLNQHFIWLKGKAESQGIWGSVGMKLSPRL